MRKSSKKSHPKTGYMMWYISNSVNFKIPHHINFNFQTYQMKVNFAKAWFTVSFCLGLHRLNRRQNPQGMNI